MAVAAVHALLWALLIVPQAVLARNPTASDKYEPGSLAWMQARDHLDAFVPKEVVRRELEGNPGDALPLRARSATQPDLDAARALVQTAMAEAASRNHDRVLHPSRNTYHFDELPESALARRDSRFAAFTDDMMAPVPELLDVSDDVASAAALLAELSALQTLQSMSTGDNSTGKSNFWMANLERKGSLPWAGDSEYQVFRNVRDFGAVGDGVTDDTVAIRQAILAASSKTPDKNFRCAGECAASTTQAAIVYFPPGTYLVSGTIPALPATLLIGDAIDRPVLKAAPSFIGLGVISTNEWHDHSVKASGTGDVQQRDHQHGPSQTTTGSFYRQVRNFIIDITSASQDSHVSGIHYQTSQAASLSFVEIRATSPKTNPSTTQLGIFSEDGSGGQISDLTIVGGKVGFYGSNSQFTAQRINLRDCGTAVQLLWDWGWVWKSIHVADCSVGFQLYANNTESGSETGTYLGSVYIMDSTFTDVGTAIKTTPPSFESGEKTTGITLDNVAFAGEVEHHVWDGEKDYVQGTPSKLDTWTMGALYLVPSERDISLGFEFETAREQSLTQNDSSNSTLPKKPYFSRSKPQYVDVPADKWLHTKNFCKADGNSDDRDCLQKAFDKKGNIFIDAGVYMLSDTVTIHPGTVVVGEAWPQLVAYGSKFSDPGQPRPMIRVGEEGDKGSVEIQDLLFTVKGATAGAILVEWNIKADESGGAAMWDCHARIGGAKNSELTPDECPESGSNDKCHGASLLMHITSGASAYLENVWLWVADHLIDGSSPSVLTRNSIHASRGMLVESQGPTWLYATSAEHAAMYQYNFHQSKKLFAAMIQTESPYFQDEPSVVAQRSAAIKTLPSDPTCATKGGCTEAVAALIRDTEDLTIAGAGMYSWYKKDDKYCVSSHSCQERSMVTSSNKNLAVNNIVSIGTKDTVISDGASVPSEANAAIKAYPEWSHVNTVSLIHAANDTLSCRDIDSWPAKPGDGKFRDPIVSDSRKMFVSMVNGSPKQFTNTYKHQYQMSEFTFGNVDPGFAPQVSLKYGPGTFTDCKGEAGFTMEGTGGKYFEIRARTNDQDKTDKMRVQYRFDFSVNGANQGETYEWRSRGGERAVNFVLTGSDKVGYWSSVNPPVAWMQALLPIIGPRKLKHITMLGSHNAGISVRTGGTIGPEKASICQGVDVLGQLQAGSRWFDVRPVIGNGGQLLTGHYSGQTAPVFGINGQAIADIVDNVNAFTKDHAELVVLSLTHAMQTDDNYRDLNDGEWDRVFDAMERLNNRCGGLQGQIPEMTLESLIGGGRACVVVLTDGGRARPDRGIYGQRDSFDFIERWSNSDKAADMAADQASWVRANRNLVADGAARRDQFAISQWIMTVMSAAVLFDSIEDYAVNRAYDPLFWRGFPSWSPWSYPSVVLMDFVGIAYAGDKKLGMESGEARALVMAANVGLASRNCWVGGGSLE